MDYSFGVQIPYFHVETKEYLDWKKLRRGILNKEPDNLDPDERQRFKNLTELEETYQNFRNAQLVYMHVPRTLDESYYVGLDCTRERDDDQVIYRHMKNKAGGDGKKQEGAQEQNTVGVSRYSQTPPKFENRILMVNQLWLWKVGGKQT
jgi:hypothetical protein